MSRVFANLNRPLFTGGSAFSNTFQPKQIQNCQAWYDGTSFQPTEIFLTPLLINGGNWTNICSPSLDGYADPLGGTNAFYVNDNTTGNYLEFSQARTIPDGYHTYVVSIYVQKKPGATNIFAINLNLSGGTPVAVSLRLNPETGAYTGSNLSVTDTGTGWWHTSVSITNNSTGNTTLTAHFYPASGVLPGALGSDSIVATGSQIIAYPSLITGSVATWSDRSGRGNDVTQAAVTNQPILYPAGNSIITPGTAGTMHIPTVKFADAAATYLQSTSSDLAPNNVTMCAVSRYTTEQSISFIGGRGATAFAGYWMSYLVAVPTGDIGNGAAFVRPTAASTTASTWQVNTLTYDNINATYYKNGVTGTPLAITGNIDYTGNPNFYIGQTTGLSAGRGLTGDIAEVALYSVALSTINRRRLERYLGTKYAITVT